MTAKRRRFIRSRRLRPGDGLRRLTWCMRVLVLVCALILVPAQAFALDPAVSMAVDSDHDGLSDELENSLLLQFLPSFMIDSEDCSSKPALFRPEVAVPSVVREDGTIYGQVFPRQNHSGEVELHYYHLWRKDCGEMGHPLDTEHVSVLVKKNGDDSSATWKASYWYAAAHEDTLCDASQIARASTLDAETRGARIWISEGKHASFLSEDLCTHGCGGDRCDKMTLLEIRQVINLGETAAPMNGAIWLTSPEWPLRDKLGRSDFTDTRTDRLKRFSATEVAWVNPAKRPAQSAVLGTNRGIGGAVTGARATDAALVVADGSASGALDHATVNTADAVFGALHSVRKALRKSAQKTGQALGVEPVRDTEN